jgi:hypothetical protein
MHFVIEDPVAFSFFSFRQAIVFSEFQQFAVEAEVLAVDNETSLERSFWFVDLLQCPGKTLAVHLSYLFIHKQRILRHHKSLIVNFTPDPSNVLTVGRSNHPDSWQPGVGSKPGALAPRR